eukprot:6195158-Pleurochrysis_carterae.AAC.1
MMRMRIIACPARLRLRSAAAHSWLVHNGTRKVRALRLARLRPGLNAPCKRESESSRFRFTLSRHYCERDLMYSILILIAVTIELFPSNGN